MCTTAPDAVDVTDFSFRQLRKLKITKDSALPLETSNLLAASSRFGLIFIGCDNGFKVIQFGTLLDLDEGKKQAKDDATDFSCQTVLLSSTPSALALSCDSMTLAVCVSKNGFPFVEMFDIRAFAATAINHTNPAPFNEVRLSTTRGVKVRDISWNPVLAEMFAVCLGDGSLGIYEVPGTNFKCTANLPPQSGAAALCWSPKGKQLVVGRVDGHLVQYKPTLQETKVIPPPPAFENTMTVVSVHWISTTQFASVYATANGEDKTPNLVIVNLPKGEPPSYISYGDVCFGNGERSPRYWMFHQQEWKIILCTSSSALETIVLGNRNSKQPLWEQWNLDDRGRAELPLLNHEETSPLGMAIITCSQRRIVISDNESYAAMPILLLLSSSGVLCPFHMLNTRADSGSLVNLPEPLPIEGERKGVGVVAASTQPSPQALFTPSVPVPFTTATDQPNLVTPKVNLMAKFSEESLGSPTSVGHPDGSQKRDHSSVKPTTPPSYSLAGDASFWPASTPFTTPSKPTLPPTMTVNPGVIIPAIPVQPKLQLSSSSAQLTLQQSMGEAKTPAGLLQQPTSIVQTKPNVHVRPRSQPSVIISSTPVKLVQTATQLADGSPPSRPILVPVAPSKSTTVASKQEENKTISNDTYTTAVMDEIAEFEKEINEMKASIAKTRFTVGTKEEMGQLRHNTEVVEEFCKAMKETMQSINTDVHNLKSSMLEAFAMLEDAKSREARDRDPHYLSLLRSLPLDPSSARRLREIRRLYQYLDCQFQEVHNRLDQDWQEYLVLKKKASRLKSRFPSTEALYRSLLNNHNLLGTLRDQLDRLTTQTKELKLKGVRGHRYLIETSSLKSDELSTLADTLLETRLSPKDSFKQSPSKLTPAKEAALRDFLSQRNIRTVKAKQIDNMSQSRIISTFRLSQTQQNVDKSATKIKIVTSGKTTEMDLPKAPPGVPRIIVASGKATELDTSKTPSGVPTITVPSRKTMELDSAKAPSGVSAITISPIRPIVSLGNNQFTSSSPVPSGGSITLGEPVPTSKPLDSFPEEKGNEPAPKTLFTLLSRTPPNVSLFSKPVPISSATLYTEIPENSSDASKTFAFAPTSSATSQPFTFGSNLPATSGVASAFTFKLPDSFTKQPSDAKVFAPPAHKLTSPPPETLKLHSGLRDSPTESTASQVSSSTLEFSQKATSAATIPFSTTGFSSSTFSFQSTALRLSPEGTATVSGIPTTQVTIQREQQDEELLQKYDNITPPDSPQPVVTFPDQKEEEEAEETKVIEIDLGASSGHHASPFVKVSSVSSLSFKLPSSSPLAVDKSLPSTVSFSQIENKTEPTVASSSSLDSSTNVFGQAKHKPSGFSFSSEVVFGGKPPSVSTAPVDVQSAVGSQDAASIAPNGLSTGASQIPLTTVTSASLAITASLSTPVSIPVTPTGASEPKQSSLFGHLTSQSSEVSITPVTTSSPVTEVSASYPPDTTVFQQTDPTKVTVFGQTATATLASGAGQTAPLETSSVFGQTSPSSAPPLFGQTPPVTSTSVFGLVTTANNMVTSEFGQTLPVATPVVGQSAAATTPASTFGQVTTANTTPAPLFGQTAPTTTTTSSLFGQGGQGGSSMFGGTGSPGASAVFAQASTVFGKQDTSTTSSLFGQNTTGVFGKPTASLFGQATSFSQPTTGTTAPVFGQPASGIFGQTTAAQGAASSPLFGQQATTTASSVFGQSTPAAAFSFGQLATGQGSVFGQSQNSSFAQAGGTFGTQPASSGVFGQGTSFFGGLGGKPSAENASKNVFGTTTFGSPQSQGSSLFGAQGASSFGTKFGSSFSGGSFTSGSGSVAQSGFGAFQQSPQKTGSFGTSPTFGTSFGGSPSFGGAPTFGSGTTPFGNTFGSSPTAPGFGSFGSGNITSTFGNMATQNQTQTFGNLAQTPPTFGAITQQGGSGGNGFGSSPSFGIGTGFAGQGTFGSQSSAFSQWRQ